MEITKRSRSPRRIAIAMSTAVLVIGGMAISATPASAATWGQSGSTKIYFKKAGNLVDTYSAKGIIRGSGSSIDLMFNYANRYYGKASTPSKKSITVQRKIDGSKWSKVKSISAKYKKFEGYNYIRAEVPVYVVPAGIAAQNVEYRLKVKKKGNIVQGDTSAAIKVKYENQSMYTGYLAEMYGYMAPFCPTAAVRVDPNVAAKGYAGLYQTTKSISFDPATVAYPAESKQTLAVHECAHLRQFYNFGATRKGSKKEAKVAAGIYSQDPNPNPADTGPMSYPYSTNYGPFNPIEHAADCAAYSIQPNGYLGYGGYCNAEEIAAGNRLLYGSKY